MPEPRRDRTSEVSIRVTLEPGSRDPAAVKRRYRRGWRGERTGGAALAQSGPGSRGSVPFEIRNGLPFKPYVYRGLGYDIYEAGEPDEWALENGWARKVADDDA